ncbi:hypothetical protein PEC302107_08630 [Pectobacterium araliae]|uniref:Uncharacterized protein n=1 Tax=Pectobacterium araliae TaxID=3073862 RepID=A0AAN0KK08_9GAMM|nr:hypothetical protein PEC302110_00210 [Pectobacterium sp. MAFF 302110]GKW19134.1 hypothetical protein PEC302107_08630 [Pectobacterium carotovorum subsp. carotovorum]
MKTVLKLGLALIFAISFYFYNGLDLTSREGEFHYSNPTNKNITFKVDGENYEIVPGGKGNIELSSGMHKLENSKGEVFSFMVLDDNNGGIINPDNHVYYTLSEVYAVEGASNKFKPATYDVTINGNQLEMPARSANASVIDAKKFKCNYQLDEPFPESIKINERNPSGNIRSKCFDKKDMLEYLLNTYKEDLKSESPEDEGDDSINMVFNYDAPAVSFLNADMQKNADEIISEVKKLKESNDVETHDKIISNISKIYGDLITVYAKNTMTLPQEESKKYNDFIRKVGDLQTYGVWGK